MGDPQCAEQQDQQPERVSKTVIEVVVKEGVPRFSLKGVLFDYLLGPEIRAARRDEEPVHVFHLAREMGPPRIPFGLMLTRDFIVGDRLVFNGNPDTLLGFMCGRPRLLC